MMCCLSSGAGEKMMHAPPLHRLKLWMLRTVSGLVNGSTQLSLVNVLGPNSTHLPWDELICLCISQ